MAKITIVGRKVTRILNIWFCYNDHSIQEIASTIDAAVCKECKGLMTNIGYVEDTTGKQDKIDALVSEHEL